MEELSCLRQGRFPKTGENDRKLMAVMGKVKEIVFRKQGRRQTGRTQQQVKRTKAGKRRNESADTEGYPFFAAGKHPAGGTPQHSRQKRQKGCGGKQGQATEKVLCILKTKYPHIL